MLAEGTKWANDASAVFVGRESPQVATRVQPVGSDNQIRTRKGELVGLHAELLGPEQDESAVPWCWGIPSRRLTTFG